MLSVSNSRCRDCKQPAGFFNTLIKPCRCNGVRSLVHSRCFGKYVTKRGNNLCSICKTRFDNDDLNENVTFWIYAQSLPWHYSYAILGTIGVITFYALLTSLLLYHVSSESYFIELFRLLGLAVNLVVGFGLVAAMYFAFNFAHKKFVKFRKNLLRDDGSNYFPLELD